MAKPKTPTTPALPPAAAPPPEVQGVWRSRIVGHGWEAPDQLLANPKNWRIHPAAQGAALEAILDRVGWVQQVVVNRRTGFMVDGHLRVMRALRRGEPMVPVLYVDLDPEEEAIVLASLDPLAGMAVTDESALTALISSVALQEPELQALLDHLAGADGVGSIAPASLPTLGAGDRDPFQQKTFTLHDTQALMVDEAVAEAKKEGPFDGSPNENGNGNALARICEAYLVSHGLR